MSEHIIALENAQNPSVGGGKAASLGRLLSRGFPIPSGFVVAADAYQEHFRRASELLTPSASPTDIQQAILHTPINYELRRTFELAWNQWIGNGSAAIRSSANLEDSAYSSFAGQFSTYLDIANVEKALQSILLCWNSLVSPHAIEYGSHLKESPELHMAVLVQRMVHGEVSGVAFSVDPTHGSANALYIEWVTGIGETLVSGMRIDGRSWVRRDGALLGAHYLSGGTELPRVLWHELAGLFIRLEAECEPRIDIEWTWSKDGVTLLQVRPITVSAPAIIEAPEPWALPGPPAGGWSPKRRGLFDLWDEYNAARIFPLEYDLYIRSTWQATLDTLGGPDAPRIENFVVMVNRVPLAIDPEGRQVSPGTSVFMEDQLSSRSLEDELEYCREEITRLKSDLGDLSKLDGVRLIEALESVSSVYRSVLATRLFQMSRWIEEQSRIRSEMKLLVGEVTDEDWDALGFGKGYEASKMISAMGELQRVFNIEGKSPSWHKNLDRLFNNFGHCQFEGNIFEDMRESFICQVEKQMIPLFSFRDEQALSRFERVSKALEMRAGNERQKGSVRTLIEEYRSSISLREDSKTRQDYPLPLLNRVIVSLGRYMEGQGALGKADDIRLLTVDDLQSWAEDRSIEKDICSRRKALMQWKAEYQWLPVGYLGNVHQRTDIVLQGCSGSLGKAIGRARKITDSSQFSDVEDGEIVLARATNPIWTQLFGRIAGIAVENGSRISHAAIVAREFSIPAVVGIPGLLEAIDDGELVEINGTAGVITRLTVDKRISSRSVEQMKRSAKIDH